MKSAKGICAPQTFKQVFIQHAPDLRNFLYARCGDSARAEDLTQEAFMRLWKNCATIFQEKAKSFLFTVGANLFTDAIRHDKVVLRFKQQVTTSSNAENPQYLLELKEFKEQLEQTLAQLPEGSRVAFMLSRFDGLSYQQIADKLGISRKAVEKRMHRALLAIKQLTAIRKNIE